MTPNKLVMLSSMYHYRSQQLSDTFLCSPMSCFGGTVAHIHPLFSTDSSSCGYRMPENDKFAGCEPVYLNDSVLARTRPMSDCVKPLDKALGTELKHRNSALFFIAVVPCLQRAFFSCIPLLHSAYSFSTYLACILSIFHRTIIGL